MAWLAVAGALGAAQAAGVAPPEGRVTYDVNSWGKNVAHWQLQADGSGELWRFIKGSDSWNYDVQKFHFLIRPDILPQLRASLEALRQIAAHPPDCGPRMTDAPNGALVWQQSKAERLSFDFGCAGPMAVAVMNRMIAVDDQIENQATIDPVPFETVHVGPPNS